MTHVHNQPSHKETLKVSEEHTHCMHPLDTIRPDLKVTQKCCSCNQERVVELSHALDRH